MYDMCLVMLVMNPCLTRVGHGYATQTTVFVLPSF